MGEVFEQSSPPPAVQGPQRPGGESLVGEHNLGSVASFVELHRHQAVGQVDDRVLPAKGESESPRRVDLDELAYRLIGVPGKLHAQAVAPADAHIHLYAGAGAAQRLEPLSKKAFICPSAIGNVWGCGHHTTDLQDR